MTIPACRKAVFSLSLTIVFLLLFAVSEHAEAKSCPNRDSPKNDVLNCDGDRMMVENYGQSLMLKDNTFLTKINITNPDRNSLKSANKSISYIVKNNKRLSGDSIVNLEIEPSTRLEVLTFKILENPFLSESLPTLKWNLPRDREEGAQEGAGRRMGGSRR